MSCSTYKPPKFNSDCKPIAACNALGNVFFNPGTNQVFDEHKNLIGNGTMDDSGEFLTINIISGYFPNSKDGD